MTQYERTVDVVYDKEERSIRNPQFIYDYKYKLVSNTDMNVCNIEFKKGEVVEMTGLLAKNCIKKGNGSISLYNAKAAAVKQKEADYEALKKKVEKLESEPKPKKKAVKKVEEESSEE